MLTGLLRLFARLPLPWLHAAGTALGWLVYLSAPSYAARLRENLLQSRVWQDEEAFRRILHANVVESGKAVAELPAVWFRPRPETAAWVQDVQGWDGVERARAQGHGLILLTPHLGCFEIIPQYLTERFALTVLYRPPHFAALAPAMRAGRERPGLQLASTDVSGVRLLLKALKRGEAIGILPDQVPGAGEGEWAPFFERQAYTMTLASRLSESTGAPVLLTYAIRLPQGHGYRLHFEPMPAAQPGESAGRWLNRALESIIRRHPAQYLWSYNRYKSPAGASAPQESSA